jgi:hypothetical protein
MAVTRSPAVPAYVPKGVMRFGVVILLAALFTLSNQTYGLANQQECEKWKHRESLGGNLESTCVSWKDQTNSQITLPFTLANQGSSSLQQGSDWQAVDETRAEVVLYFPSHLLYWIIGSFVENPVAQNDHTHGHNALQSLALWGLVCWGIGSFLESAKTRPPTP